MNQMSTGDQSEYLRRKMAERRATYEQGGQFMKSGFSRWAENERPARVGGALKDAAEKVSTKAGKDILNRVKALGEDMYAQYYKGSGHHIPGRHEECESSSDEEDALEGGFRFYGSPVTAAKQADASILRKAFGGAMAANMLTEGGQEGGFIPMMGKVSAKAMPVDMGLFTRTANGLIVPKRGMGYSGNAMPQFEDCPPGYVDDGLLCRKPITMKDGRASGGDVIPKKMKKGKGVGNYVAKKVLKKGADMAIDRALDGGILPLVYGAYKGQQAMKGHVAKGRGFKEGVMESKKVANDVGNVAISGFEVYEDLSNGKVLDAIDKGKALVQSGMSAAEHAKAAANEFQKMGSGRATRAAIVKRVMKEKGLSLPAASKYVKEHGLYKK